MCGWMAIGVPSLSTDANVSCVVRTPMLRRQCLDAVDNEKGLKIHRLLGPQLAVIVEGGDALGCSFMVIRNFAARPWRVCISCQPAGQALFPWQ